MSQKWLNIKVNLKFNVSCCSRSRLSVILTVGEVCRGRNSSCSLQRTSVKSCYQVVKIALQNKSAFTCPHTLSNRHVNGKKGKGLCQQNFKHTKKVPIASWALLDLNSSRLLVAAGSLDLSCLQCYDVIFIFNALSQI